MLKIDEKNNPLTLFKGVLVLGNNNKSDNPMVAVYNKGAILNDIDVRPHFWPNWSTEDVDHKVVRNYPIAPNEIKLMSKSSLKQLAGIKNLVSSQVGYRLYKDTLIGDLLYITYDTNHDCFQEAMRCGFIDRKTFINLDKALAKKEEAYDS